MCGRYWVLPTTPGVQQHTALTLGMGEAGRTAVCGKEPLAGELSTAPGAAETDPIGPL